MKAALFDMDRTLVRVETASLYVKYQREIGEATWRDSVDVAWWVGQYTLGLLDAPKIAAKVIGKLKGFPEIAMQARCDDWARRYVAPHVSDAARLAVKKHRDQGDLLAIVTGASPYAAGPIARMLGIPHVVASELEVEDHVFTGRPVEPLCYGEGKIVRTTKLAREHGFTLEEATFYSDSYTDLPLLAAVGFPVVVNPDPRLAREAKKRKWPVERW
jgi:HAD superfamily hydrolase (TIGR01490 family)